MTTPHTAPESWAKLLTQYGFAAALCLLVLWFVGNKMVLPMQEVHTRLIDRVADTNEKNAETQSRQTAILERIERGVSRGDARQVSRMEER